MDGIFETNVMEASASTGAGALALTAIPGFRRFADALTVGKPCHYSIKAVDVVGRPTGEYEFGIGTYSAADTLTRTTVIGSSNANAAVVFAAGTKYVTFTALAPNTDPIRFDWQDALGLNLAGAVAYFAMNAAPTGWVKCNGAAVSRTTYARLFTKIGTTFGAGDGSSTFALPDLRGEFIRGWDDGRAVDSGRAFATAQTHLTASHNHGITDPGHAHGLYDPGHAHSAWTDAQGYHDHANGLRTTGSADGNAGYGVGIAAGYQNNLMIPGVHGGYRTEAQGSHGHNISVAAAGTGMSVYAAATGISVNAAGGAETRPRNLALLACIKY